MSLFKKKTSKYASPPVPPPPVEEVHNQSNGVDNNNGQKTQLVFHCQQAQGSPLGLISGFANVKELYQKIAECYDFPPEDILFCTLNSHKVDMKKLLGGQIGLEDFIFAHRKGRPKEIEIVKTEDSLGLTITDNGAGYSFIKRIKEHSIVSRIPHIEVGDHIERLEGENMVGKRHYEVAKLLKDIPLGTTFTIRLVEPLKSGFGSIGPKSGSARSGKKSYGSGKETLRFKANGQATIENEHDDKSKAGIEKINELLESFMGINDSELATQMWDLAEGKTNSMQLAEAIDNSDLQEFGFTDEFIIELWGAITDARSGRLS
ncbi:PDZ domain-containing protein GIPC3 [Pieris brassicae]|uniref:PDZ domain-containing protein GIPC3 n=1 Tax=Pieris brassicae TaxID=7116 RepID=UPI001E65E7CB|nr:PDZ domain-containing protein GIPC3 [Pieris brassicae]